MRRSLPERTERPDGLPRLDWLWRPDGGAGVEGVLDVIGREFPLRITECLEGVDEVLLYLEIDGAEFTLFWGDFDIMSLSAKAMNAIPVFERLADYLCCEDTWRC